MLLIVDHDESAGTVYLTLRPSDDSSALVPQAADSSECVILDHFPDGEELVSGIELIGVTDMVVRVNNVPTPVGSQDPLERAA